MQKVKVTTTIWDSLTPQQQEILEKLGVSIYKEENGTREPKYKIGKKLDGYYLGVNVTCRLCGFRYNGYYRMEPAKNYSSPFLRGVRLNPMKDGIIPNRWEEQTVPACKKCKTRLLELPKEKLIDKLMFLTRCYTALGGGQR